MFQSAVILVLIAFSRDEIRSSSTVKKLYRAEEPNVTLIESKLNVTLTVPELDVALIESTIEVNVTYCVDIFLSFYEKFCETALLPRRRGKTTQRYSRQELCPCVPRHLLGEPSV